MIRRGSASVEVRACLIDGEAIVVDANGLSVFDLLRYRRHDHAAVLCAFDLIELDDKDLRSAPIEERKDALANLLFSARVGLVSNVHDLRVRLWWPVPRLRV